MALNLKNPEVDVLAAEVAVLADESKTEAVHEALLELAVYVPQKRSERAASILREFRATLSDAVRGKRLSREEEDDILGFGPGGV